MRITETQRRMRNTHSLTHRPILIHSKANHEKNRNININYLQYYYILLD